MTFKQMNISEPVCRALLEKNYSTPTLIQEQAIPEALTGRDLLGLAQPEPVKRRHLPYLS